MTIVSQNSNSYRSHTGKTKAGEMFEKFIGKNNYDEKLLLPFEAFLHASFCKYPNKVKMAKLTLLIATEDCATRSLVKPKSTRGDDRDMQSGEWEKSNDKVDDGSSDDSDNATVTGKSQYEINKEKNIEEIKQKLAELEEQYPLPKECAQKKIMKAPAVKKGQVQNETAVRQESQRGKDKIA